MILIITNSNDVTANYVTNELDSRAVRYFRLDTDKYPQHMWGTARFGFSEAQDTHLCVSDSASTIELSMVKAVWYRRPVPPFPSLQIQDQAVRKFATDESYEFLRGLWYSLDCKWVSHPNAIRRAEHKVVQLKMASQVGFTIPKTVITNNPEEVKSLWSACPTGIVAKPLYLGFIDDQQAPKFIYTTQVSIEDLERVDTVSLAPSIYQERIEKASDIRVTVVGRNSFAAKIFAPDLPTDIPDWRYAPHETLRQEPHELPPELSRLCIQLTHELGLSFGAIDLGLDREGRYFFFEINPNGQWAWLETDIGLKISAAIANELLGN